MKFLNRYADDVLLLAGCVCILYGIAQWNIPVTWISGGVMLIGWGVLIGKVKAKR